MFSRLPFGRTLAAILAIALVLRLAAGAWWQQRLPAGKQFGFGDSEGYWELGRTIARGQPYAYGPAGMRIFRTPGYPAILAPLFLVAKEPLVVWGRMVGAVLATAAVAAVAWLGRLLFDARIALVAAAITAVYPEAIAAGAFVLSEAPFTPLMLLHLIFWTLAWQSTPAYAQSEAALRERRSSQRELTTLFGSSLAAGIAAGLATLMRPSWLLFIPFACAVGLVANRHRKSQLLITLTMTAALCLTLLPWWVRNYQVAGRFVPTSLQVGASLYDGLSPRATGASNMDFVGQFVTQQRFADAAALTPPLGLFEDRLDQRLRRAATDWATQNPQQVLALASTKFFRMWSFLPNASEFQSTSLRLILALTYTPVILLAIAGVWKYARRDWPYLLCCLPAIYFTLLHVVFVSSIRYRQPAMLPLIVLAAAVIVGVRGQGAGFRVQKLDSIAQRS